MHSKHNSGITITETMVAAVLLAAAFVPCLKALTAANTFSTLMERKTRSLMLAQQKIEDIRAASIYSYSSNFAKASASLGNSYFYSVTDTAVNTNLREIQVSVGFDADTDNLLSGPETLATLKTLVARRWK